jgi:hypothetical protein
VKICDFLIPVDFVVLDIDPDTKTSLILGRPFLSTADASIDAGAGMVHLHINGKWESFAFRPKMEQCNRVQTFNCTTPRKTPKPSLGHKSRRWIASLLQ